MAFDSHRKRLLALRDAIASASPELWYPQGVSSTRVLSDDDALAWYVA